MREIAIKHCLNNTSKQLNKIINKVHSLQILTQKLHSHLDRKLSHHCQVADFYDGKLVIAVTNGSWATLIRYAIPDLLEKLRREKEFDFLQQIQCIIQPTLFTAQKNRTIPFLSPTNSQIIQTTAQNIKHAKLRHALLHLSKNVK